VTSPRVVPKLKSVTAVDDLGHCPHLADPRFTIAAVTLQPAVRSPIKPVATLLCGRCALRVSEAILRAMEEP
jgi:hypothetical protein